MFCVGAVRFGVRQGSKCNVEFCCARAIFSVMDSVRRTDCWRLSGWTRFGYVMDLGWSKVWISCCMLEFLVSGRFGVGQGCECNADLSIALRWGAFRIQLFVVFLNVRC